MKQTILRRYARLIARAGVNIQKGQDVIDRGTGLRSNFA